MHPGEQVIVVVEHGHRTTVTPVPATAQQIFVGRRLLTADPQKYFALVSITFAAERTPSVMRPTIALSSFQHCQHSGTSRFVSHTPHEQAVLQHRCGEAVREHAPSEPTTHSRAESLGRRDEVLWLSEVAAKYLSHQHVLPRIVSIPRKRRRLGYGASGSPDQSVQPRDRVGSPRRPPDDYVHRLVGKAETLTVAMNVTERSPQTAFTTSSMRSHSDTFRQHRSGLVEIRTSYGMDALVEADLVVVPGAHRFLEEPDRQAVVALQAAAPVSCSSTRAPF
jgi:hypothetical protein